MNLITPTKTSFLTFLGLVVYLLATSFLEVYFLYGEIE